MRLVWKIFAYLIISVFHLHLLLHALIIEINCDLQLKVKLIFLNALKHQLKNLTGF
jgi:hypothetical protein